MSLNSADDVIEISMIRRLQLTAKIILKQFVEVSLLSKCINRNNRICRVSRRFPADYDNFPANGNNFRKFFAYLAGVVIYHKDRACSFDNFRECAEFSAIILIQGFLLVLFNSMNKCGIIICQSSCEAAIEWKVE